MRIDLVKRLRSSSDSDEVANKSEGGIAVTLGGLCGGDGSGMDGNEGLLATFFLWATGDGDVFFLSSESEEVSKKDGDGIEEAILGERF